MSGLTLQRSIKISHKPFSRLEAAKKRIQGLSEQKQKNYLTVV